MTADQTIAIISFVAGAAAALAGAAVTLYSTSRDRDAARALASEERRQQRLETTYQELITYLARHREQYDAIRPFLTFPGQAPPASVPLADMYRARAVTIAHASPQVWGLLDEFDDACRSIISADAALRGIEDSERQTGRPVPAEVFGMTGPDFHKRLFEDKQRLAEIERRIHEQIRSELGAGDRMESAPSTGR